MSTVLIVDDEPFMRLLLEQTMEDLEEKGVQILIAENGREALEIIKQEEPDIVFLDVMMPEMDGYETCRIVKREWNMDKVHIVLLTAKGQEFDRKKGLEEGADEYMTKPFDPDAIVEKVTTILMM